MPWCARTSWCPGPGGDLTSAAGPANGHDDVGREQEEHCAHRPHDPEHVDGSREAAEDEKAWTSASFDPAAVATAQLTAWIAPRTPGIDQEDVAEPIADELALRYDVPAGLVMEAALQRANALALSGEGGVDPDWPSITRMLTASYASLGDALRRAHARRAPRTAP